MFGIKVVILAVLQFISMNRFFSILCFALCALIAFAAGNAPSGAIPFILDSHLYFQATLADSVPVSLIYDTGADRLYLDKDFMALSAFGKTPFRKSKARLGGAGNNGEQSVSIIVDPLTVQMGDILHTEYITPIINLREILGRHADGLIGNNALFDKPLIINYHDGYILRPDTLSEESLIGFTKLPAQFNDNRIDLELELYIDSVQTIKGLFRLDLGCGSTIILTNVIREKLNLEGKRTASCYLSNAGVGGDGSEVCFRADSLKFIDVLPNMVISASSNTAGALSDRSYAGIIGNEILKYFDIVIDAPGQAVYARRNADTSADYQRSSKTHMGYYDRTDISDGWPVCSLFDGGIAQQAGFEIGDVILSINGRPVKEITWEEQRKGLGLSGKTEYVVRKANGEEVTYTLDIQEEVI